MDRRGFLHYIAGAPVAAIAASAAAAVATSWAYDHYMTP